MKNMLPFRPAIVVMAKAPRAKTVKTRLTPFLTDAEAAALARCFLQDAIARAQTIEASVIVAFAPADAQAELERMLPGNLLWHEQTGADLGDKLQAAIRFAVRENFSPVAVIGTDSPTLSGAHLQTAIDILRSKTADIVLGASADGGFYLVAVHEDHPTLFDQIEWSSSRVFRQISMNIERLNLRLAELPIWYDVDTPEDVETLRREIQTDEAAQIRAPKTFEWITEHFKN